MESSTDVESMPVSGGERFHLSGPRMPLAGLIIFLATAGMVAIIALSLVIGIRLSSRVEDLEREVPELTAQLAAEDSQVLDSLLQLRVISYWLAYPANEPLLLEPPDGTDNPQGVALIADDGRSAILMVVNMEEVPVPSDYQVWLTAGGQRVRAGRVKVPSTGWGIATLYPSESVFAFDGVEVTAESEGGAGSASGVRVLEGRIVTRKASR